MSNEVHPLYRKWYSLLTFIGGNVIFTSYPGTILDGSLKVPVKHDIIHHTGKKVQQKCQGYLQKSLSPSVLRKKQQELDHQCQELDLHPDILHPGGQDKKKLQQGLPLTLFATLVKSLSDYVIVCYVLQ
jgi:hypothetical protein